MAGAFIRGLTKHLAPQGGAFTRALKFEKLKAYYYPVPGGDTNDWCINSTFFFKQSLLARNGRLEEFVHIKYYMMVYLLCI